MAQTETTDLRYASDPDPEQAEQIASPLNIAEPNCGLPLEQRGKEVLRLAQTAFAQTGAWVVFYREMLGTDGLVRRLYPTPEEMRYFEDSNDFAELQEMVAAMRSQDASKGDSTEPERNDHDSPPQKSPRFASDRVRRDESQYQQVVHQ